METPTNTYDEIYDFWFNKDLKYKGFNLWINTNLLEKHEIDRMIYELFADYKETPIVETKKQEIGRIIKYDQIIRHFNRFNPEKFPEELVYSSRSFAQTLSLIYLDSVEKITKTSPDELIFILMPLKHTDIQQEINGKNILEIVKEYVENNGYRTLLEMPEAANLNRFYKDTFEKYYEKCIPHLIKDSIRIRDWSEYREIMDEAAETKMEYDFDSYIFTPFEKTLMFYLKKELKTTSKLVVSLSGGIDSMSLVWALAHLRKKMSLNISAFHLIYNNRVECHEEYEMIRQYCQMLEVPLYVFEIRGINRRFTDRDFFEKATREIRFKCYRSFSTPIFLGHIQEDVIENIWTNFVHGRDLFYLKKMYPISRIEGVMIARPLLETKKEEIIEYGKLKGIPFTKNTTPSWSNRGMMRERFRPLVSEMWGPVDDHLLYMSETLSVYGEYIEETLMEPFHREWVEMEEGWMNRIDERKRRLGIHFWHTMVSKLFLEKIKEDAPSRRAIEVLTEKLINVSVNWFPIKKGWECKVDSLCIRFRKTE